jgi:hypothetical protein
VAALRPLKIERRSSESVKPLTEALEPFVERRASRISLGFPHQLLRKISQEIPEALAKTKSYHFANDREIVADLGPSIRSDGLSMMIAEVRGEELSKEPMSIVDSSKVLEKHHPMVYSMHLQRSELSTNTAVFELGLYSRVIGQERKDYIGKAKVFFPRPHTDLMLFVDLSKIH